MNSKTDVTKSFLMSLLETTILQSITNTHPDYYYIFADACEIIYSQKEIENDENLQKFTKF